MLSGLEQHQHATEWLKQGLVGEIWVLQMRESHIVQMGIRQNNADLRQQQLRKSGIKDSQIRLISIKSLETDLPSVLRELGQECELRGVQVAVLQCQEIEARFLRQIADAALPRAQADRLRFIALPHNEYVATQWWRCRRGWKGICNMSLQILYNQWDGPTTGFERTPWNPDEWEAETFPGATREFP